MIRNFRLANENCRSSNRPITETRAFRTWFGDSKVTDSYGKPLVMYHGTYIDFDAFRQENFTHHFTPDPNLAAKQAEDACWFASRDSKPFSPRILPVYVKVSNPFDPRMAPCARLLKEWGLGVPTDYDFAEWEFLEDVEVVDKIRTLQYDGIWMRQGLADYDALAVFDPKQIKSAIGNNGAFDPTSPSMIG
jgi:hypothetical protein